MEHGNGRGGKQDDVTQAFADLWNARLWIASSTLAGLILAAAYAFMAQEIYRAEALVQPREEQRSSGLGALAAQFGALADLPGITLGGTGDRAVAIATLKSRAVVERFIEEKKLLPRLYRRKWDPDAQAWKSQDPGRIPTTWEGYRDFTKKVLKITDDKKTGLVSVAVEWEDPVEAQAWVTELVARTNAHLRSRAIREAEANLAYLEEQSKKIGQVELQRALYGLVETELKKLMVARAGEEFAVRTIDPAVVPRKRERPRRLLIIVAGTLLGGFTAATIALMLPGFVARLRERR
jgi:uncharacterized protein involved in exopolysaccharide biosynthesis